jgi:hypothetical protein
MEQVKCFATNGFFSEEVVNEWLKKKGNKIKIIHREVTAFSRSLMLTIFYKEVSK